MVKKDLNSIRNVGTNADFEFIFLKKDKDIVNCIDKKEDKFLFIETIKNIPPVFEKIPDNYINNIAHWGNYSENEMDEKLDDGTKKLLHLDIDFGKKCRLNCPHCFKNNNFFKNLNLEEFDLKELSEEDLKQIILNFKNIGLKTIKICGAGEPFDNKNFIDFLQFLYENGLGVSVFTKGYVLGNDELVSKLYGHCGINTGLDLCKKLKELDVSVLFGLNSFDRELQKQHSGAEKWDNYIDYRDQALVNLVNAGLNEYIPGKTTRLAIIMAPVRPENLLESRDIYIWSRMRNMYPVCCPVNNAGLGKTENEKIQKEYGNYEKDLIKLYSDIYIRNIEHGIISLETLEQEGISLYPGCHPCTQTRVGGYLNLYGELLSCPGHDTNIKELQISKNIVEEKDYLKIWKNSENYKRTGFNQKCIARDNITLGFDFYDKIMIKVKKYFVK